MEFRVLENNKAVVRFLSPKPAATEGRVLRSHTTNIEMGIVSVSHGAPAKRAMRVKSAVDRLVSDRSDGTGNVELFDLEYNVINNNSSHPVENIRPMRRHAVHATNTNPFSQHATISKVNDTSALAILIQTNSMLVNDSKALHAKLELKNEDILQFQKLSASQLAENMNLQQQLGDNKKLVAELQQSLEKLNSANASVVSGNLIDLE